jgi:excisionase family DNA binding protein
MEDKLLTIEEVAERIRTSISWVYKKCRARFIPHIRIGGLVRVREKALDKWILDHEVKGALKI